MWLASDFHVDNHSTRLDRLRARGYIGNHTERSKWLLGTKPEVPMEALFVLVAALAALIAVDFTTIDWNGTRQGR